MIMQLTPHFGYNSKYDTIKCPCEECKDDKIVRINPAILWVAEMIRAILNSRCSMKDKILLKVNSGSRCVKHHIDIYKKMRFPRNKIPLNSSHIFWASTEALTTALDITPISETGKASTEQLLDEVEGMMDKDWPGGFHRYEAFFHMDLGKMRRW